jgi:hypothetical protein
VVVVIVLTGTTVLQVAAIVIVVAFVVADVIIVVAVAVVVSVVIEVSLNSRLETEILNISIFLSLLVHWRGLCCGTVYVITQDLWSM